MTQPTVEDPAPQAQAAQEPAVDQAPDVEETPCDPWPEPYYLENGLRRVAPYYFTYNTFCKERWRGRTLLDIFGTEFRDRPKAYYKNAIETGQVTINGEVAQPDSPVLNGAKISHTLHRHEPPVTALPIGIIHEDDDIIVIDKPAGVPVHPAGRYNHNSIVEIMRAERGHTWNPRPCNRLDRLTSGVMFIGKHPKGAEAFANKLQARTVQKEYIARVKGKFPDGIVLCDQPLLKVSPMLGLNRARASGKDAKTKFRKLAYFPPHNKESKTGSAADPATPPATLPDEMNRVSPTPNGSSTPSPLIAEGDEGYSIVHCLPLTGRTHQIRVHLQFLGHPITNDPIYSNRRVFGPNLGKADATGDHDNEIIEQLKKMGKTELADTLTYQTFQTPPPTSVTNDDPQMVNDVLKREHEQMVTSYLKRKGEKMNGETCKECGTELFSDPGVHELGIFLHAVSYSDTEGEWRYKSKMPAWAKPPKGMEGPTSAPDWTEREGEDVIVGAGVMLGERTVLVEGIGPVDLDQAVAEAAEKVAEEEPAAQSA
ncbi:hypothetical protein AJ80_08518 [Polytolypa hystricis UAMH7299]|uniref:Pseudouridine synthase RsuA/RluA-like domain-containing protein n=1 Tax=Polytolypa hystricis (strain UAMH7299) TaxID=1447883 RepID=A0A2B7X6Q3_POLH7|nr:hypothetical protein AJ80_08518 [Polytolypa hystricis UAMH7299]